MGTRSTIAVEHTDGTVHQVYCHWDGYLDNNGKILLAHYSDAATLSKLIRLGDMSSLRREIGKKHDFDERFDAGDERRNWTTFYRRDRGEKGCYSRKYKDYADYQVNSQSEEYDYILRSTGEWYVRFYTTDDQWILLKEAIANELIAEALAEED